MSCSHVCGKVTLLLWERMIYTLNMDLFQQDYAYVEYAILALSSRLKYRENYSISRHKILLQNNVEDIKNYTVIAFTRSLTCVLYSLAI